MKNLRLQARVKGLVQGVSFRFYTQRKAIALEVVGWVRNESNGDVTLVAEGPERKLQELLEFVQVGPPYARVDGVDSRWSEPTGEFRRFVIAR